MMKKWILRLTVVAVILIIGVVTAISMNLNRIVRVGIETVGPEIAKVPVNVESVSIMPFLGKGSISGLQVGNPKGFDSPTAIEVSTLSVDLKTSTINSPKLVIHSIEIKKPTITLEGGIKKNNLTRLLDQINESAAKPDHQSDPKSPKGKAEEKASKALQIDSISITGATVKFEVSILKGMNITVPLKDIQLSGLGQGEKGITSAELSAQILDAILTQTTAMLPELIAKAGSKGLNLGEKETELIEKGLGGLLKGLNKK